MVSTGDGTETLSSSCAAASCAGVSGGRAASFAFAVSARGPQRVLDGHLGRSLLLLLLRLGGGVGVLLGVVGEVAGHGFVLRQVSVVSLQALGRAAAGDPAHFQASRSAARPWAAP